MSGGGACWRADDADGRQQLEVDRMSESSAQNREEVERGEKKKKRPKAEGQTEFHLCLQKTAAGRLFTENNQNKIQKVKTLSGSNRVFKLFNQNPTFLKFVA